MATPELTPLNDVSYLRFLNAGIALPPLDIYINGSLVAKNLQFKQFTEYFKTIAGLYAVRVYAAGTTTNPIISQNLNIIRDRIYTCAVIGIPENASLQLVADIQRTTANTMAYMRFVNLSPDDIPMDIYIDDEKKFSELSYHEVSNYIPIRPGKHSITLKKAGSDVVLLEDPSAVFKGGDYYAGYIVGLVNQNLQILIPLEGASYLKF